MKYFAKNMEGKLFLCSRDIQVGDIAQFSSETEPAIIVGSAEEGEKHNGYFILNAAKELGFFKVIGEISSEAIWVTEGDEFDEYEIWAKNKEAFGDFYVKIQSHSWNMPRREKDGWEKDIIKVKGPCGHFH